MENGTLSDASDVAYAIGDLHGHTVIPPNANAYKREYRMLCPYHDETKPSLGISDGHTRVLTYCFACGNVWRQIKADLIGAGYNIANETNYVTPEDVVRHSQKVYLSNTRTLEEIVEHKKRFMYIGALEQLALEQGYTPHFYFGLNWRTLVVDLIEMRIDRPNQDKYVRPLTFIQPKVYPAIIRNVPITIPSTMNIVDFFNLKYAPVAAGIGYDGLRPVFGGHLAVQPEYRKHKIVFVEGPAKIRAAYLVRDPRKYLVLSWHGGVKGIDALDLSCLQGRKILNIADADEAGHDCMIKLRRKLKKLGNEVDLFLPKISPDPRWKDIKDWTRKYNSWAKIMRKVA